MAGLVDQWGNPVSSALLKEEAMGVSVTGIRDRFDDFVASGLNPARMATILREAALGEMHDFLTLAEEMEERETQYASVMSTRKRAIQSIELQVEAASDDGEDVKIADAVREQIAEHPDIYDVIGDMLDALGKGYSVVEIKWDTEGRQWNPAAFEWHDPRLFQFDRETRKELRKRMLGNYEGAPLEPYKFIRHIPRLKSGIPARNGLARLALWVFLLKSYSLKDWAAFLEVHGMPLRLGKFGPGASVEDRRVLLRAVRDLGADAAAIIPKEMEIEFIETKGFSEKPFEGLAIYLDKSLSKAIIGQTMTADEGASGGLAQARVHETVRTDIKKADARQLEGTLARDLVHPFVDLNYGPRPRYPKVTLAVTEQEDIKTLSEALKNLIPVGLKVQMSEVRDRLGFADPEEGSELMQAAPPPETPAPVTGQKSAVNDPAKKAANQYHMRGCPCCGAGPKLATNAVEADAPDERDLLVEEGLADYEPNMGPIIKALQKAAREATSYEGFVEALDALAGTLPVEALADRIAIQTMKARGLGETQDDLAG